MRGGQCFTWLGQCLEKWKANLEPGKTMKTDLEPWTSDLAPWKPTCSNTSVFLQLHFAFLQHVPSTELFCKGPPGFYSTSIHLPMKSKELVKASCLTMFGFLLSQVLKRRTSHWKITLQIYPPSRTQLDHFSLHKNTFSLLTQGPNWPFRCLGSGSSVEGGL